MVPIVLGVLAMTIGASTPLIASTTPVATSTPPQVVLDASTVATMTLIPKVLNLSAFATSTITLATTTPAVATSKLATMLIGSEPTSTSTGIPEALLENCYMYSKSKVPNLPHTIDLYPNTPAVVGAVALFNYHGIPHYAVVLEVEIDRVLIDETNFHHGRHDHRVISLQDPSLLGFWVDLTP